MIRLADRTCLRFILLPHPTVKGERKVEEQAVQSGYLALLAALRLPGLLWQAETNTELFEETPWVLANAPRIGGGTLSWQFRDDVLPGGDFGTEMIESIEGLGGDDG